MNDIDIAIERIKNDETILVDLLNDEGANVILKKSGESIGSGRCIFHGGSKNKLYIGKFQKIKWVLNVVRIINKVYSLIKK